MMDILLVRRKFQISDFRFQIANFRLQISDFGLQVSDFGFFNLELTYWLPA